MNKTCEHSSLLRSIREEFGPYVLEVFECHCGHRWVSQSVNDKPKLHPLQAQAVTQ